MIKTTFDSLSRQTRLLLILPLLFLGGCGMFQELGYYAQSAQGHFALLSSARPVADIVADPATSEPLRQRLLLTQRIRDFSIAELHLPDNASYRRYADIRPKIAPVWNVVAAPSLSLKLESWCFPVAGCVQYRGYYDKAHADAFAAQLAKERPDLEVNVYRVPAYSTLGYSNWLGGDPLLSSFIGLPEGELARLIFHELAHQVTYAASDTAFNEGFASAVEQLGLEHWMQTAASPGAQEAYQQFDARRQQFLTLTRAARAQLQTLYDHPTLSYTAKRAEKTRILDQLRADYQTTKTQQWQGFSGYDHWFQSMNNASFAALALYEDTTEQFIALHRQLGGHWPRFYAEVARQAQLPKEERSVGFTPPAAPSPSPR